MKNILIILFLSIAFKANAQQDIGLRISANFGHLYFTNSLGEKSKTLKSKPDISTTFLFVKQIGNVKNGYGQKHKRRSPFQHQVLFGVGFKSTTIEDQEINTPKKYDLNYTSVSISYRFTASLNSVGIFSGLGLLGDYMISGTQFNNGTPLDISSQIKKINASVVTEAGLFISITRSTYATLRVSHNIGMSNLEKTKDQKAHLSHTEIGLGLLFRI